MATCRNGRATHVIDFGDHDQALRAVGVATRGARRTRRGNPEGEECAARLGGRRSKNRACESGRAVGRHGPVQTPVCTLRQQLNCDCLRPLAAVVHEPVAKAAAAVEVARQQLAHLLGVAVLRQRREPDQVGEHHRDEAALRHGIRRMGGGGSGRKTAEECSSAQVAEAIARRGGDPQVRALRLDLAAESAGELACPGRNVTKELAHLGEACTELGIAYFDRHHRVL